MRRWIAALVASAFIALGPGAAAGDGAAAASASPAFRARALTAQFLDAVPPLARDAGWAAYARDVDLANVDKNATLPAGPLRAAGVATFGYADVNACSGTRSTDAGGIGAFDRALPDCSAFPPEAYYRDARTGAPLTESYDAAALPPSVPVLQFAGDPGSAALREATAAHAAARARELDTRTDALELDDAYDLDEAYLPLCAGLLRFEARTYRCPAGAPLSGPQAARLAGPRASRERWIAGERALVAALPEPAILNALGIYAPGERVSAGTEVARTSPNAWGGICEACFDRNNLGELATFLRDVRAVLASGKRVIDLEYGSDGGENSWNVAPRGTAARAVAIRENRLALLMLVYEPGRTYEADTDCGGASGVAVCPEAAFVFAASQPYRLDRYGNYLRTGDCAIAGVRQNAAAERCFVQANGRAGAGRGATPTGLGRVRGATPLRRLRFSGDAYVTADGARAGRVAFADAVPAALAPGEAYVGIAPARALAALRP